MEKAKGWILVVGILIIAGLTGYALVRAVQNATEKALEPVNELSGDLDSLVDRVFDPTPTVIPDPITIVRQVRSLARLETIQYSVEKVITAEIGQGAFGFLFGDRLLFVAHGVVIAGVDMAKLGPQDVWVADGALHVRLPAPEVFIATLDNKQSYVYDREIGVLNRGDINLETTARRVAEREIENAALEDGILLQAGRNAENYLATLFRDLGYLEVIFVQRAQDG